MERMDEFRRRRERRIQHILSSENERPDTDLYETRREDDEKLYEGTYYERDKRFSDDPEYEWNHRINPWKTRSSGLERSLRVQAVASVIIFAAVWALFQWDHPSLARTQSFISSSLTEELQFERFAAWYQDKLGDAPAFIPALNRSSGQEARNANAAPTREYAVPAKGNVVEPFGSVKAGAGVIIRTGTGAGVSAMDTGLVTFAGQTADTGMTVMVRHPGGVQSVYGHLEKVNVKENDWVQAGEQLGTVQAIAGQGSEGNLYFAVNRSGDYVNPVEVVPLD